jgi:hypothetical protein
MVMWETNVDGQRVALRILLMDTGSSLKLDVSDAAMSAWEAYIKTSVERSNLSPGSGVKGEER